MRRLTKQGRLGIVFGACTGMLGIVGLFAATNVNPWDTIKAKGNGCYTVGCSACNGNIPDSKLTCGNKARYCNFKCNGDSKPQGGCFTDDGC